LFTICLTGRIIRNSLYRFFGVVNKNKIVEEFRNGNLKAFEKLFKHFHPSLLFFASRLVRNSDIAEEIVDEALYKIWENKGHFESYDRIKAFLYITVKNLSLDELSKQNRRLTREEKYADGQSTIIDSVDEAIIQAEFYRHVRNAICKLPGQCRIIMLKLFEEGKSPKEIAAELNISISTVNNQKARGLQLLRSKLHPKEFYFFITLLP
jgi:RNA polymerase sigma-70 factor (family 1)